MYRPYANNKDADQPAHPCSLSNVFDVRCVDSVMLVHVVAISDVKRLLLPFETEQASLSLSSSYDSEGSFSHDGSHLFQTTPLSLNTLVSAVLPATV